METPKSVGIATKEEMINYLKSNGWFTIWNEDNWIHNGVGNCDWGGRSLESAYQQCLEDNEENPNAIKIKL